MPEISRAFANVMYDTAASPFLYRDAVYAAAAGILGSSKILFGSDYPLISPERYVRSISEQIQDEEAREEILFKNAVRLLPVQNGARQ